MNQKKFKCLKKNMFLFDDDTNNNNKKRCRTKSWDKCLRKRERRNKGNKILTLKVTGSISRNFDMIRFYTYLCPANKFFFF